MPRALVNRLSVHYQQFGQGPDLILVHGLFCNLAFWYLTVVPVLAERFRVTVYDLRGHGFTDGTDRGYRAVDLAEDLLALLDHLKIDRAHFAGHSFGGAVALAFAIRHTHLVSSLTLADAWVPTLQAAPLARDPAKRLRTRLKRAGIEVEDKLPRVAYGFLEELVRLREVGGPQTQGIFDGFGSPVGGRRRSLVLRRWLQLVRTTSAVEEFYDAAGITKAEISTMRRPAVAMFGSYSKYLPTLGGLQRHLPDCRSILIPEAGHFFPILRPNAFTETVIEFAGSAWDRVESDRRTGVRDEGHHMGKDRYL
jgi:pimeloyl-ACP methyl ester carboxylesterase